MDALHRAVIAASVACAAALTALPARAQDYPKSPVTIIVGFAPGSTADVSARIVGNEMGNKLGQRFVVETRLGAASSTAAAGVARAPKDGYTLFIGSVGNIVNAAMRSDLTFDFAADFAPITLLSSTPTVLVTGTDVAAKSVKDLVQLATDKPDAILFGSSGVGSSTHLALELFKTLAKVKVTHVPYTGSPGVITDLLANRIHGYFAPASSVMEHVKVGKVVALAVTDTKRSAFFPELPTVAETGIAGFESTLWFGLMAPSGTPQPIIDALSRAANEALQSEEVKQAFQKQYIVPIGGSPEDFARTIATETKRWTAVVAATGLKRP
ncbi:MAG TPA: tripartite tricarboxylate transporter substrate-binding protein [Hyphomicrobiaceae bacterium]|jgi:tripartite-type tricarboxylate transporter receptor subunit TctC|nr:tripartite tricarboxylate transporter substrate-binding protein [Hyphomicrobiaceae bacterium]